jgi:hypothetical protein
MKGLQLRLLHHVGGVKPRAELWVQPPFDHTTEKRTVPGKELIVRFAPTSKHLLEKPLGLCGFRSNFAHVRCAPNLLPPENQFHGQVAPKKRGFWDHYRTVTHGEKWLQADSRPHRQRGMGGALRPGDNGALLLAAQSHDEQSTTAPAQTIKERTAKKTSGSLVPYSFVEIAWTL